MFAHCRLVCAKLIKKYLISVNMPKNKLFRPTSPSPTSPTFSSFEKMPPKLWAKKVCRQKADYRIHHPFPFPQPAIPASWTLWTARGARLDNNFKSGTANVLIWSVCCLLSLSPRTQDQVLPKNNKKLEQLRVD